MTARDDRGRDLRPGTLVRRKLANRYPADPFLCHPFSFGSVVEYVTETQESRADHLNPSPLGHGAEWREIVVLPWDRRMSPEGDWLQWAPDEVVPISRFCYVARCLLWPLLRLLYPKPLVGQDTGIGDSARDRERR